MGKDARPSNDFTIMLRDALQREATTAYGRPSFMQEIVVPATKKFLKTSKSNPTKAAREFEEDIAEGWATGKYEQPPQRGDE